MSTPEQQAELEAAKLLKQLFETNKAEAVKVIGEAEGGLATAIANGLRNMPKPGGFAGVFFKYAEPSLENYVTNLITKNGPEVVYEFIDAQLSHEVAVLEAAVAH